MTKQVLITIRAVAPEDANANDIWNFCYDALGCFGGQFEAPNFENGFTGNPMFNSLDVKAVTVRKKNV